MWRKVFLCQEGSFTKCLTKINQNNDRCILMAKVELRINQIIPTQKQLYPKREHKKVIRSFYEHIDSAKNIIT